MLHESMRERPAILRFDKPTGVTIPWCRSVQSGKSQSAFVLAENSMPVGVYQSQLIGVTTL